MSRQVPQQIIKRCFSSSNNNARTRSWMKVAAGVAPFVAAPFVYKWLSRDKMQQKSATPTPAATTTAKPTTATTTTAAGAEIPGDSKSLKKAVLETGAELIQSSGPLNSFHSVIDGFRFVNGDMRKQYHAYEFVDQLNEDVAQCLLFDTYNKDARLIGVEYIISEKIFNTLPDEEKKLWHSNAYEVKAGLAVIPRGLPLAEKAMLKDRLRTYGKTWIFWQQQETGTVSLPLGIPQLGMSPVDDGQVNPRLLEERDREMGINTNEVRKERADFQVPQVLAGADSWRSGKTVQVRLDNMSYRRAAADSTT